MTRRGFALSMAGACAAASAPTAFSQSPVDVALAGLTLAEASSRIRSRQVTPTQLVQACLERINTYNPKLNAFITVMREQALAAARDLDQEQRAGKFRG